MKESIEKWGDKPEPIISKPDIKPIPQVDDSLDGQLMTLAVERHKRIQALGKQVSELQGLLSGRCLFDMQGRVVYSPHIEKEIAILRGAVESAKHLFELQSMFGSAMGMVQALAAADKLRGPAKPEPARQKSDLQSEDPSGGHHQWED